MPAGPIGIVVSPSVASPSEGTSSDSCLTSAGDGPAGLSGHLAAQGLLGVCSPFRLASPLLGAQSATPVLQAQGALGGAALLPVSFQEGRRASDTSLTQGNFFHARFHLPRERLCVPWAMALSLVAGGVPRPQLVLVEQQCFLGSWRCCPDFDVLPSGTDSHGLGWLVLKAHKPLGCQAAAPDLEEGRVGGQLLCRRPAPMCPGSPTPSQAVPPPPPQS